MDNKSSAVFSSRMPSLILISGGIFLISFYSSIIDNYMTDSDIMFMED